MFLNADSAMTQISLAVASARERFGHSRFQVLSWPQTWANTSCGFGGISGQAFTEAQTVIVSGEDDAVLVYHCGRFAYEVKEPTEEFWIACGQRNLPGAKDWGRVIGKYDSSHEGGE